MPKREVDKIIKQLKKKTKTKHRKRKGRKVARPRPYRKILTEEDLDRRLRDSIHHMSDKDRIDRTYPHSFMKQRAAAFSAKQQAKSKHEAGIAKKTKDAYEHYGNPAFVSPDDLWRQPAMQPNYNLPSAPRVNNDPIIQSAAKAAAEAAVRPVLQAIERQKRGRGRPGDSRKIREGLKPYIRQSRHPEGGFYDELPGGGVWAGGASDSSQMAEIMRSG